MKRRQLLALFGGTALMPFVARAQQAMPVIGLINGTSAEKYEPQVAAFRQGLKESGFVDGENVTIEYRWAEGDYSRLPALAADLVKRRVAVIVANTPANIAAKKATDTIPVVFTTASDPVQIGLVTNLNHPGGNVTGVTQLNASLGPKRLELAHELLPAAADLALLSIRTTRPGPRNSSERYRKPRLASVCSFTFSAQAPRPISSRHWRDFRNSRPARSSSVRTPFTTPTQSCWRKPPFVTRCR
jgi:putative ABC transport system substrate-binding protein